MTEDKLSQLLKECLADEFMREILFALELGQSLTEYAAESKRDLGNISKKLKRLQEKLAIRLTESVGRRLVLNEAGKALAGSAHIFEDALNDIVYDLCDNKHFSTGD